MSISALTQSIGLPGSGAQQADQSAAATQAAAPAPGAMLGGILAALKTRVKPIDANFVMQLAALQQQQMAALQMQQMQQAAMSSQGLDYSEVPGSLSLNSLIQSGAADAAQGASQLPLGNYTDPVMGDAPTDLPPSIALAAAYEQQAQQQPTAPTSQSIHIAQFRGPYLPDGPTMRPNCGPASVVMALRKIGLDIPGFNGENSEAVLDKARILATGQNNIAVGTTDSELERLIEASGGKWSESTNFAEMTQWIKSGVPVVLAGNPAQGWNHRYSNDQVYKFDGGHWVTVSGYNQQTGKYIVNDPLSQIGAIEVTEQELYSYNQANGGLGIGVFN